MMACRVSHREMMDNASPLIETLESRRMLSAAPSDPASLLAAAQTGALQIPTAAKPSAKQPKAVVTTTPSLVHDYEGTLKTAGIIFGLGSRKLHFELLITGQTSSSLTGVFTVGGHDGNGTLTGFEKTNGRYSYSIKSNGFTLKIAGRESNNGLTLGGNASIKLNSLSIFRASGGFIVNADV